VHLTDRQTSVLRAESTDCSGSRVMVMTTRYRPIYETTDSTAAAAEARLIFIIQ